MTSVSTVLARVHRWLGVPLAALVAVWFASGIVMTFGAFPAVTERARLERSEPLPGAPSEAPLLAPAHLPGVEGLAPIAVRLVMRLGTPVYEIEHGSGTTRFDARTGTPLPPLDAAGAAALAERWLGRSPAATELRTAPDTWTPRAEAFGWLPMVVADAGDADGTIVYISLPQGDVVQVTTSKSRLLAWLGAIPHWLYLLPLRRHGELWEWTVVGLAALSALATVAGMVLGTLRLRAHRRRHGSSFGPFRKPLHRWHHGLGLTAGTLALTWVSSGALSLDPFEWHAEGAPPREARRSFQGGSFDVLRFEAPMGEALAACGTRMTVKRLDLVQVGGAPFYVCRATPNVSAVVPAGASEIPSTAADAAGATAAATAGAIAHRTNGPTAEIPPEVLASAIEALVGGPRELAPSAEVTRLLEPDAFYYPTHYMPDRPFPVLRVRRGETTFYVDPSAGRVLRTDTAGTRAYRWAYHGLHSFDFPWLLRAPWAWHLVVLTLAFAGLALATTATVLSARRVWSWRPFSVGEKRGAATRDRTLRQSGPPKRGPWPEEGRRET